MRLARLLLPAMLVAVPAQAGTLIPHRAVYDLALENASDRSGITGLAGRMVYEFSGSRCDGYTVTFRFVTQIDTSETSRMTDQQTTTYEDGDGKSFRFVTRSFVDQAMDTELRGSAKLSDKGTEVSLQKPAPQKIELGASQFPTQHLLELLNKAKAGDTFYETTIYDGSEDADRIMTTTVVIGRSGPAKSNDPELGAIKSIARDPFWPVEMAYFDLSVAQGEELPSYRISFKLHESGVTRDLVMDYGDFSMTGRLVDLAMFEAPDDCPQ